MASLLRESCTSDQEHLSPSRSTEDMKKKQSEYAELVKKSANNGMKIRPVKIMPTGPRKALAVITLKNNTPIAVSEKPFTAFF